MANYTIVYQDCSGGSYYTEYVVDNTSDISSLPVQPKCSTGSKVTVIATGAVYKLNHNSQWIEQPSGGGGGSVTPEERESIIQEAVNRSSDLIVDGAPIDMDTLKEVSDWIDDDEQTTQDIQSDISNLQTTTVRCTDSDIDSLFNN